MIYDFMRKASGMFEAALDSFGCAPAEQEEFEHEFNIGDVVRDTLGYRSWTVKKVDNSCGWISYLVEAEGESASFCESNLAA